MPETANPLRKFFRQPAIYIRLPSDGNYYPEGSIEIPPNRELAVYPMTAIDEITYRTADALFNGSALVNVIQSCVPAIKDAWQIPSLDLDTLLIAIRIASYGHEMDFESNCPHCDNENSFGLDLRQVLDNIKAGDYSESIKQGDIEIFFRPLSYEQANANSMKQFQDQKILDSLPSSDLPEEEKIRLLTQAFQKLTVMTISALSGVISMIRADGEIVVEPEHIEEFVRNCDREVFNQIRDHATQLREHSELKPLKLKCDNPECLKEYETPFTLDVSNFFASAS
jgi:hypothetical protein